ncbi:hypothetical protein [Pseudaquidulcibacter saccharophilus]|uniref:hypothetical protein n=1 Tax=Pseudaquidulcibacter saccharophilus TaxID=2831900 RepID=UPI001EFF18A2|nr:hypothetical protein [Pseudaquidulcibacter saccharophilus]
MGLSYLNLDTETRNLMLSEIDLDISDMSIYISSYLNEHGVHEWPNLTRLAAELHNDDWLAMQLNNQGLLLTQHKRRNPRGGGFTLAKVPITAANTLSEAQFNLYYIRALAIRASKEGAKLIVYRAKEVERPRPESELLIGSSFDAVKLLDELRITKGVNPASNIPLPNSGLTFKLG